VFGLGVLLLASNTATTGPASPVTVTATARKTEVTVGEVFGVELKATGPPGATFTFAGEAESDAFELRTAAPAANAGVEPDPSTHRYHAAVYVLGEATIPPIPVRYRLADGKQGEASSEPIVLKIVSLLPKDPQQQRLADIRGPQPVGIARAFWIALAAALVLVAGFLLWLVRRRRSREAPRVLPQPELAPDAEALRALDALLASGLLARAEHRAFYIRLTVVAKRYLERRLGAPVLEMTTAETLAFLRGHPAGGELLTAMRDVAEAADRIKFARGHGLAQEAERHLAAVRALVPALEARLEPVAAEAGEKAA
jgi:hypothetical protein